MFFFVIQNQGGGALVDVCIKKWDGHYVSYCVKGHAGYAKTGVDIVCAAVSGLVYMLERALPELSDSPICADKSMCSDDEPIVHIIDPDGTSDTIMRAFELGIQNIAESYPENVKLHLS